MKPRRPASSIRGSIRVEVLLLLAILPLAGFLFVAAERKRRRALRQMAGERGEEEGLIRERRAEFYWVAAAVGCLILALARPTWKDVWVDTSGEGRDVVFLLDTSRSMLGTDVVPNRLEAAKTAIRECVKDLQGDRVGLVAFSGSASILCPLTSDLAFFYDKLEEAHPDFIPAGEVRVGGTRIGDAIRKTTEKLFTAERKGFQDLILMTDGEDQQSAPEATVERLGNLGVYLIAIGVGDATRGSRIPAPPGEPTGFVQHDGVEVWTRLESKGLESLAKACRQGVYLEAGTRVLPLGKIYPKLVKHLGRGDPVNTQRLRQGQETFPLFLALALVFLAPPWRSLARPLVMASVLLFPLPPLGAAPHPVKLFREGRTQLDAKNHATAIATFLQAAEAFPDTERRAVAIYNAGLSAFLQAASDEELDPQSAVQYYGEAVASFRACLAMKTDFADAAFNLELAMAREAQISAEIKATDKPPADEDKAPKDAEQKEKESAEGNDKAESPDDAEGESSEEPAEGEAKPANQSEGSNAMDLESQDLPPPSIEPEELFRQESEQGDLRQKQRSTRYKAVEKDW